MKQHRNKPYVWQPISIDARLAQQEWLTHKRYSSRTDATQKRLGNSFVGGNFYVLGHKQTKAKTPPTAPVFRIPFLFVTAGHFHPCMLPPQREVLHGGNTTLPKFSPSPKPREATKRHRVDVRVTADLENAQDAVVEWNVAKLLL